MEQRLLYRKGKQDRKWSKNQCKVNKSRIEKFSSSFWSTIHLTAVKTDLSFNTIVSLQVKEIFPEYSVNLSSLGSLAVTAMPIYFCKHVLQGLESGDVVQSYSGMFFSNRNPLNFFCIKNEWDILVFLPIKNLYFPIVTVL